MPGDWRRDRRRNQSVFHFVSLMLRVALVQKNSYNGIWGWKNVGGNEVDREQGRSRARVGEAGKEQEETGSKAL